MNDDILLTIMRIAYLVTFRRGMSQNEEDYFLSEYKAIYGDPTAEDSK